jgi:hypothetical protein
VRTLGHPPKPSLAPTPIANPGARGARRVSLQVAAVFAAIRAIHRALATLRESDDFAAILHENFFCASETVSDLLAGGR